jgi:hypothetical protein
MSALNHLLFDDGAMLLTDAASNVGGVISAIGSKVRRFPHLNAVCGYTGSCYVSWIAETHLGRTATTFDGLIAGFAEEVREAMAELSDEVLNRDDTLSDLLIVGFSETSNAYQAWRCTFGLEAPPEVRQMPRASLQPWTDDMAADLKASGLTIDAMLADPAMAAARAREVMEIQRRHAAPHGCVIGGFQEQTAIQRGVTVSAVVSLWPDRLGAPVTLAD